MSLSDLASLGSFVSGVAVLASLLYLAIQVRQNRKHTEAQISQSRVQLGMERQDFIVADAAVADIILRGARADRSLSESEHFRFFVSTNNLFVMIEDEFRQYQAGLISEARHKGFVRRFSRGFGRPGYRAMWRIQRDGFEEDFQTFMDELVQAAREKDLAPELLTAWQAAAAAELEGQ